MGNLPLRFWRKNFREELPATLSALTAFSCGALLRYRPIAGRGIQIRIDRPRLDIVEGNGVQGGKWYGLMDKVVVRLDSLSFVSNDFLIAEPGFIYPRAPGLIPQSGTAVLDIAILEPT
jgi:hypothetical protein